MGAWWRFIRSCRIALSVARMREAIVTRRIVKCGFIRVTAQMCVNPRKSNVSERRCPPACAALGRATSKFQNPRLLLIQRDTELRHPLTQCVEKAWSLVLCFEAHDAVVRVADDDNIPFRRFASPLVGPEVEDVVQINIGEERRDHRALRRTYPRYRLRSTFDNASG